MNQPTPPTTVIALGLPGGERGADRISRETVTRKERASDRGRTGPESTEREGVLAHPAESERTPPDELDHSSNNSRRPDRLSSLRSGSPLV